MRHVPFLAVSVAVLLLGSTVMAATIKGEYLEARSCNVYTGPCFANGEMDLAGKEAVMAWKVDQGAWEGVSLDGLGVALVVQSEGTLGFDGVFEMRAGKIESVILVDEKATEEQKKALVAFVKDSASKYTKNVRKIRSVPFELRNDHLSGEGVFTAGDVASIKTREIRKSDCVCSNEIVFYLPLVDVENYSPAYSLKFTYQGNDLDQKWKSLGLRGCFLATFRR